MPNLKVLQNIYRYQTPSEEYPNSDFCLQNVINLTISLTPVRCHIDGECRKKYYQYDRRASGYILTHKLLIFFICNFLHVTIHFLRLLLLQLARARKCLISDEEYDAQTKKLCSLIFSEVISADYFEALDEMFDLFLEEGNFQLPPTFIRYGCNQLIQSVQS